MLPKYEIFSSLLTGSWMPWLDNNRQQDRFEHMLQAVNDSNGNACSTIFKMLVVQSGSVQSPAMQRFSREAGKLAEACTNTTDIRGTAFFSLSAPTPRQQFYNLITGYSLNGYDRLATQVLSDFHGTETCDFYRMRMADTLVVLLKCAVPLHNVEPPERLIVFRIRAALCILLHRLTAAGSDATGTIHPPFNIRNTLLAGAATFIPDASARDEIIGLFDALTGEKIPPATAPAVYAPAQTSAQQTPAALTEVEHDVIKMAKEMKQNVDAMLQVVSLLTTIDPKKEKQQAKEPEQYLDGAKVRKLLDTSSSSMQRFRDSGKLPYIKIGGKYCYSLKDVYNLIEKGKNEKIKSTGNLKSGKPNY